MTPLGVLLINSSSGRYGADRQLQLLAAGMDRSRYEPLVIVPDHGQLVTDLQEAGVEVMVRPLSVIRRELATPSGIARIAAAAARDAVTLSRLVKRRRIALIHSNTSVILSGAAAAAVARIPHIWQVREIYSRFGRAWPPFRALLSTAAALPCSSRATAAQFRASDPVHLITEGLAVTADPGSRTQARAELGLDPDAPVIAVLGRITDWKGQDVLVRALAEPALAGRGTIGVIAGDVWPGAEGRRERVVELAAALGVTDRVRLIGFRDDVETVYGAADVVAVPSTQPEPLGNVAVEAAAAGCAVIASNNGGLADVIRDGETGRLIIPGDASDLARVAAELFDDPAQRRRLGAAAAADVRERYSVERLLDATQGLYDTVLA